MPIFLNATTFALPETEIVALQPGVMRWQRLEAHPTATDLAPGLEARIADPLWLVGRQWQLAELKGEDAGTPIRVELHGEKGSVRFPADSARGAERLVGPQGLIEPVVEAEHARGTCPAIAAQAGLDFERALSAHSAASLAPVFREKFPFAVPETFDATLDPFGARFLILAAGRAIDGRKLAEALSTVRGDDGRIAALPAGISASPEITAAALAAATGWFSLWSELFFEPPGTAFWRDSRLEYSFAIQAEHSGGMTKLAADEYSNGRLDWWPFDTGATVPHEDAHPPAEVHLVRLPVPIRYPGMPSDRYWEFENGSVNLANQKGGPTSVTMMLALEYELVASNDWFQVPLELEYGSAFWIKSLTVTDTFGRVSDVRRASAGAAGWALFELARTHDAAGSPDLFVLPSVTAEILEGSPIEEITLFRDEMANLVWGVEKRVPGLTLEPISRRPDAAGPPVLQQRSEDLEGIDAAMLYRLQSLAPINWFPFTAEADPSGPLGSVVLLRRNLRRVTVQPGGVVVESVSKPHGILLHGRDGRFAVEEREVPRSGVIVTRNFQYARTASGGSVLWLARRKRVGHGEGASDLRYDILEPVRTKT